MGSSKKRNTAEILIDRLLEWEVDTLFGLPGDGINALMEAYGVELNAIDFVKFAEACGGVGFRCAKPKEVRGVLEQALTSKRPALVEAVVDPFEPPMPPRISVKQAAHMAKALARGEPHRGRIALTLFRDKVQELF